MKTEPKIKLTKPQGLLLVEISMGDTYVVDSHPPAKKLVSLGLARWNARYLSITDAGRKHLEELT